MQLAHYLSLLHRSQTELARALREVGQGHADEVDVLHMTGKLATRCDEQARRLAPFVQRYAAGGGDEPERLHSERFRGAREGGLGLLRDLQDVYLMASECEIAWTVVGQAAQGARDEPLGQLVAEGGGQAAKQVRWIRARMKEAAPQALVVA